MGFVCGNIVMFCYTYRGVWWSDFSLVYVDCISFVVCVSGVDVFFSIALD